jgi:xylulokinase
MTLVLEIAWSAPATTVRLRDTAARSVVAQGQAPHPDPVEHRQDPAAWWSATVDATRAAVGGGAEPDLVLVDDGTPRGGLVALGREGEVLTPALLGSHEASAADADWLVGHTDGGEQTWLDATGARPAPGSTVALLSWLHRSEPEAWAALARVQLPSGWLVEQLSGAHRLSAHAAIGTGVVDRGTGRDWRTDLLAVVDPERDWPAALPHVAVPADPVGVLTASSAEALGLPAVLPVHTGSALPGPSA